MRRFLTVVCAVLAMSSHTSGDQPSCDKPAGIAVDQVWQTRLVAVGDAQTGMYYDEVAEQEAVTAPATNDGKYCKEIENQTIEINKYSLCGTLFTSLFTLNANWQTEKVTIDAISCKTCCEGPSCQINAFWLYKKFSYIQQGYKRQVRTRPTIGFEWGEWQDCGPNGCGYCVLRTALGSYLCTETSHAEYEPALLTGDPCNP